MVLFVGRVSVSEAAALLGVGVARVHQRIADGSLRAERIGSQWVVDEVSLLSVSGSSLPGRRLSGRSVWALVALSQADRGVIDRLASSERSRARARLRRLLAESAPDAALSQERIRSVAALLRAWFRNRAERRLYRASPEDLPDLRGDVRFALSGLSHPRGGIASGDMAEGYVAAVDLDAVVADYLLSSVARDQDANVVVHVVSDGVAGRLGDVALLLVAADLADHARPREEARAVVLLREIAEQIPELVAPVDEARAERGSERS